jgi:lipopolysaccharide export system ATP-binding protein
MNAANEPLEVAAVAKANEQANSQANARASRSAKDAGEKKSVLRVENLRKVYKKREVVRDVSLAVESGEVVGLLGPNGAGKTTCFYMIVGLVPLDGGQIFLDAAELSGLPMYRRSRLGVAYLPQEASIFRKLTVAENIQAVLELRDFSAEEVASRCDALMDELHISHLRNNPAISLSGGERRRVEIARALAVDPRFVLLDEPFAGVDPIAVIDIQEIIKFLKNRGIGVLITDHNVRETLGICDHAYIINQGSVLAFGKPAEIIEDETVRKVYLGENFRL